MAFRKYHGAIFAPRGVVPLRDACTRRETPDLNGMVHVCLLLPTGILQPTPQKIVRIRFFAGTTCPRQNGMGLERALHESCKMTLFSKFTLFQVGP